MQLNATLGNLDETLRLCNMDASFMPPPSSSGNLDATRNYNLNSTKGGNLDLTRNSNPEECDDGVETSDGNHEQSLLSPQNLANETFSGKMIGINEVRTRYL